MPERAVAKSFPIKIARRCDKSGAAPATPCFAGGSRAGEMARVSGRDVDFASLRHQHIGARVPVAWLESNETSCILYTSGTTGKPKGVQRDVGGYAVALATSMDTILAAKRAVCSLCFGYRLGGGAFVYRLRAAAGGDGDYRLRRITDRRTAACGGKSSRNIRLAGCSQRRPPFAC